MINNKKYITFIFIIFIIIGNIKMSSSDGEESYESLEPTVLYSPPPSNRGVKTYSLKKTKKYSTSLIIKQPINYKMPTIIISEPREILDLKKTYESDENDNMNEYIPHKKTKTKKKLNAKIKNNYEYDKDNIQNNLNINELSKKDFQNKIESSDNNKSFSESFKIKFSDNRSSKNSSIQNIINSRKKSSLINLSKALMNISESDSENENENLRPKKMTYQKPKKTRIKKKKTSHNEDPKKKFFVIDPNAVIRKRKQSCYLKNQNDAQNPFSIKIIGDLPKKSKEKNKLKNISNKTNFIDKEFFRNKTARIEEAKTRDLKRSYNEEITPSESILSDDENSYSSRRTKHFPKNAAIGNNINLNKKEKNLKNKHDKEKEKFPIFYINPGNKKKNKKKEKTKITIVISKNNYINNDREDENIINSCRNKKKINKVIDVKKIRKKKRPSTLKYKSSFKTEEKKKKIITNQKIHSTNKIGKIKSSNSFDSKISQKHNEKIGEESDSEATNDKNSKKRVKKLKKKDENKDSIKIEKKFDDSSVDSFYFPRD